MDSLVVSFSTQAGVSTNPNSIHRPHPRLADYKAKPGHVPDQEQRRLKMLEEQKSRRLDANNQARQLVDVDSTEFKLDDVQPNEHEIEDVDMNRKRKLGPYKDQLMLSEWLVDIPADFSLQWLFVVCPVGRRGLVIASKGLTSVYTKSGHCVNKFPSSLPGGSRRTGIKATDYSILDCIYHEPSRTFYVLDVMCWRGHPVYDSETEFRFYWAQSKLAEQDSIAVLSRSNPFRFLPLEYHQCSQDELVKVLTSEMPFKVDGILFYHKQTHYMRGTTPLVTWLTPELVHDVLGITISETFLKSTYADVDLPMEAVAMKEKVKHKKKHGRPSRRKQTEMETETGESQDSSYMETVVTHSA